MDKEISSRWLARAVRSNRLDGGVLSRQPSGCDVMTLDEVLQHEKKILIVKYKDCDGTSKLRIFAASFS